MNFADAGTSGFIGDEIPLFSAFAFERSVFEFFVIGKESFRARCGNEFEAFAKSKSNDGEKCVGDGNSASGGDEGDEGFKGGARVVAALGR